MINPARITGALLLLFLITQVINCQQNRQTVTLYAADLNSKDRNTRWFHLEERLSRNIYKEQNGFRNVDAARSTCVRGIWLFYESCEYIAYADTKMEYHWHIGSGESCVNFRTISGRVTSVRYAGRPDNSEADTLTVYEQTFFSGKQQMYTESSNVGLYTTSLIITGRQSWSVCDQSGGQGHCVCIRAAGNGDPRFVEDTRERGINISSGAIRSIRKCC